jgi:hypothetical protein
MLIGSASHGGATHQFGARISRWKAHLDSIALRFRIFGWSQAHAMLDEESDALASPMLLLMKHWNEEFHRGAAADRGARVQMIGVSIVAKHAREGPVEQRVHRTMQQLRRGRRQERTSWLCGKSYGAPEVASVPRTKARKRWSEHRGPSASETRLNEVQRSFIINRKHTMHCSGSTHTHTPTVE